MGNISPQLQLGLSTLQEVEDTSQVVSHTQILLFGHFCMSMKV